MTGYAHTSPMHQATGKVSSAEGVTSKCILLNSLHFLCTSKAWAPRFRGLLYFRQRCRWQHCCMLAATFFSMSGNKCCSW